MPGRAFRILLAFLALAVFWTWPLASHLSSRIPHDPGDPVLNTWLLWWNAHAVPFTSRWWNPPMFFPMRGALALSEHLAGIGVIVTPLQLLHANALAAYNIALILSFALSGFFTFLLVGHLLRSTSDSVRHLGALSAALAYGFGPYRAGQLAHLQVLTSQWMPLSLFAMHAHLDDGRRRWLALFAVGWLLQALSNGYYLLFFPVFIGCWLLWFIDWRHRPARGLELAAVWGGSSLLLVPILLEYAAVQRGLGLVRTAGEMALFSARPESFFNASGMLALWRTKPTLTTEEFLFPGITTIVLTAAALSVAVFSRQRVPPSNPGGEIGVHLLRRHRGADVALRIRSWQSGVSGCLASSVHVPDVFPWFRRASSAGPVRHVGHALYRDCRWTWIRNRCTAWTEGVHRDGRVCGDRLARRRLAACDAAGDTAESSHAA